MQAPVRIWSIDRGIAHGVRLDIGETVEFELSPGDTIVLSPVEPGGHADPVLIDVKRLRVWMPQWGGPGAA